MDSQPIEIRDDKINVEEIMARIRENIRRKRAAGEIPQTADSLNQPELPIDSNQYETNIGKDLSCINNLWNINNNRYFISSHHPYLGKILVRGRQLVHGEVRRYVDPIVHRQTEFNASTVRILNQTTRKCLEMEQKIPLQFHEDARNISQQEEHLSKKIDQQEEYLSKKIDQQEEYLSKKIDHQEKELNNGIKQKVNENYQKIFSLVDKDLISRISLLEALDNRMHKEIERENTARGPVSPKLLNYSLFEDQFRGSREEIKKRQQIFLPYFKDCSRVLDIGCGRGEFLEILRENNIGGIGIDIDKDMVDFCTSRQLTVEQTDAIDYLEKLEDNDLDGIFLDQVAEHMESAYLIRMLSLCCKKLKAGKYIVVGTVNPLSLVAFFNFYLDISHQKPIHPHTLQFIMEACRFRETQIIYYSEIPEHAKLKKIDPSSIQTGPDQQFLDNYNYNIDLLNLLLWGPMDYAAIGRK